MDIETFRKNAHETVDWIADYFREIESFPVKSPVKPGDIIRGLPDHPPRDPETYEQIMKDLNGLIMPGITHWQSPMFFAYFNANNSFPSILGEMITAAIGAQCMSWQTSPAATELEEMMMRWTAELINLPEGFTGVIQDTASVSTLCSILTAREKVSSFGINQRGLRGSPGFRVYCSTEAHSSIEKAVKIAGIGSENLIKIKVDDRFAMDPDELGKAIEGDRKKGYTPLLVTAAFGTTGSTAVDPIEEIGRICRTYGIWYHIDAAYAGTALMLDSNRHYLTGVSLADTFVFNPHKWMFTNFDCSAYYVKDRESLIRTFSILPEYLRTAEGNTVNNYRDWGPALGRRFRALKLWFVLRSFGTDGLREKVQSDVDRAQNLCGKIREEPDFELLAPVPFSTICFRYHPFVVKDEDTLNTMNNELMETLNASGRIYLTHTKLGGKFTLRLVIGQTCQRQEHIDSAWDLIKATAKKIKKDFI